MRCKTLSVVVSSFIGASLLACTAVSAQGTVPSHSLRKISRRAKYELRQITLTKSQQDQVKQIVKDQVPVEETVTYYKARTWKGMGVKGEVFVVEGNSASGAYRILALVKNGSIVELVQDKVHPAISQEFLSQFVGRSIGQPFDVAVSANELLQIPSKIRPAANNVEVSKEIALKLKKVVAQAVVLK